MSFNLLENNRRNRFVAVFGQPTTVSVASPEVKTIGYSRCGADQGVIKLEGTLQPLLHTCRASSLGRLLLVKPPSRRIDQESVVRGIDLDVGGTQAGQFCHFFAEDFTTSARNDSRVG